jgi:hypothetical protein
VKEARPERVATVGRIKKLKILANRRKPLWLLGVFGGSHRGFSAEFSLNFFIARQMQLSANPRRRAHGLKGPPQKKRKLKQQYGETHEHYGQHAKGKHY